MGEINTADVLHITYHPSLWFPCRFVHIAASIMMLYSFVVPRHPLTLTIVPAVISYLMVSEFMITIVTYARGVHCHI